jgi:hypothetical protein
MTEFVIAGAKVFDGDRLLGEIDVHVTGELIRAVGGSRPEGVEAIDGAPRGCAMPWPSASPPSWIWPRCPRR